MIETFNPEKGRILLEAIEGFWDLYKPWKESCNKYERVFQSTNVGHLLNQTAFHWMYVLTERYSWKSFVANQQKPIIKYPATSAIQLIGNCIKHNNCCYKEERNEIWVPGFKEFCDPKHPWMKGTNVEPPIREFKVGNPINLSTVARAKNKLKDEIASELA